MKKITRIFAKKPLSFHIEGTKHTIRIHALHEAPAGEPANEYKFFVLSSCDAFCPRSYHLPTIPLRKNEVREIKSLNVTFI